MIQIQSTSSVGTDGIKILVYGKSGTGKTTLCSTAPNPIIISAESGLLSLRRFNLPFIEIRGYNNLVEAFNWASSSAEARQFYTICIDSISEIAEVVLAEEKRKSKDPRKAYGEVVEQTVALVKAFRDIKGKSVVVLAKEEYDKDEVSNTMLYGPAMPGKKLGPALPYLFDEVFQILVGKDTTNNKEWRALRTKATFQHSAKDRSGMLEEYEPADLTHVFKKILGI